MKRVLLVVAYDGSKYHGWQIQPNGVTIESELNRCLSELLGEEIKVSGASRTDAGVHAKCNLAVFDTKSLIPASKISFALNQYLPSDIRIRKSFEVNDSFHPRFAKTEKTYEYKIYNDKLPDPLRRTDYHFCYYSLDLDKMRKAASFLAGEHDFAAFCSANAQVESTVREITYIEIDEKELETEFFVEEGTDLFAKSDAAINSWDEKDVFPKEIIIRVSGYGFLYNMVRIIAGTLIEVGRGALPYESVLIALSDKDREKTGPTAPANGLTLTKYKILK